MGKFIDLTGKRFGKLLVLNKNPEKSVNRQYKWDCQCECGNKVNVSGNNLREGETRSCGCLAKETDRTTHGKTGSKVYHAWGNIKKRCYSEKDPSFEGYGSKGIKMDEEFRASFEAFYAEVGDPPDETRKWSVDRIDNDLGYVKGNMRWASSQQQAKNKGKYGNNTSGFTGVSRESRGKQDAWVAQWNCSQGKRRRKYFNINKFGCDLAFKMACEYREAMLEQLKSEGLEYSDKHGF